MLSQNPHTECRAWRKKNEIFPHFTTICILIYYKKMIFFFHFSVRNWVPQAYYI